MVILICLYIVLIELATLTKNSPEGKTVSDLEKERKTLKRKTKIDLEKELKTLKVFSPKYQINIQSKKLLNTYS